MAGYGAEVIELNGAELPTLWGVPFAGLLLSIAIFPLISSHFWERHYGKITSFWIASFLVPFTYHYGISISLYQMLHVLLHEYLPFILLLLALYTVSGGIRIAGAMRGTPKSNLLIMLVGTGLASWMGTTGAAMLLIRPLLRANRWRKFRVHTVVFFIFLVANIGGSLSPLGDPPLFLGFLKGVDFFWPTAHMFAPMMMLSAVLLAMYYIVDMYYFAKEPGKPPRGKEKIRIQGVLNQALLVGILATVLMKGMWSPGLSLSIYHVPWELEDIMTNLLLVVIIGVSITQSDPDARKLNRFSWLPMVEVAKLFLGIFITMLPVVAILKSGGEGSMGFVIDHVSDNGTPNNEMYFWATGLLSSFLDNAPTYLVFFNTAGGDAQILMTDLSDTLLAISAGAVFMGAMTYIGNAPNFMVRSIAVHQGIKMPSFFGYIVWSSVILLPLFFILGEFYFA